MGGAIFTFITQIRKPRLNLSWVTWPRGLLSLAFSFEKLMKCPCLFTTEGEEKEFFRALMPAAPAQPGWAASRSSRFQKGNDSLVFPLGKPFLIQSKLFLFLFFFLKQWALRLVKLNSHFYYKYFFTPCLQSWASIVVSW